MPTHANAEARFGGRHPVVHGEPAVGCRRPTRLVSPGRGGIRGASAKHNAGAASRALFETEPDVAPCRARHSFCDVVSHGWLAVGQMTAPAARAFGRRCRAVILLLIPLAPIPNRERESSSRIISGLGKLPPRSPPRSRQRSRGSSWDRFGIWPQKG